jgi:hypothetical protein
MEVPELFLLSQKPVRNGHICRPCTFSGRRLSRPTLFHLCFELKWYQCDNTGFLLLKRCCARWGNTLLISSKGDEQTIAEYT